MLYGILYLYLNQWCGSMSNESGSKSGSWLLSTVIPGSRCRCGQKMLNQIAISQASKMYFQVQEKPPSLKENIQQIKTRNFFTVFFFACLFWLPWSGTNQDQDRNSAKNPPKNIQQNSFLTFFADPVISSKPTKTVPLRQCCGSIGSVWNVFWASRIRIQ